MKKPMPPKETPEYSLSGKRYSTTIPDTLDLAKSVCPDLLRAGKGGRFCLPGGRWTDDPFPVGVAGAGRGRAP